MDKSKGKDRAPIEDAHPESQPDLKPQETLLSQVAASASGLARSAFAAPTRNELSDTAAALSSTGKTQPSRSSSVPEWAESFIEAHQSSGQAGSSSFKLADTEQHVQNSEAEFSSFLDGTDAFTPSAPEPETSHTSTDWFTNPERHRATPKARAPEGPLTVEEQEELDGQEVRDILSSFDPDEQFVPPPEDDLEMNWGLSKDQLIALRSITRELLPIDIPREDSSMPFATNRARIYNTSYRPGETTEAWKGVLNGYTDDVWGSMLPLVRKARVELEQDETDEVQKPRGPTLERLRIILNHLKKYDDIPILLPG